jgi:hypothetical protein
MLSRSQTDVKRISAKSIASFSLPATGKHLRCCIDIMASLRHGSQVYFRLLANSTSKAQMFPSTWVQHEHKDIVRITALESMQFVNDVVHTAHNNRTMCKRRAVQWTPGGDNLTSMLSISTSRRAKDNSDRTILPIQRTRSKHRKKSTHPPRNPKCDHHNICNMQFLIQVRPQTINSLDDFSNAMSKTLSHSSA